MRTTFGELPVGATFYQVNVVSGTVTSTVLYTKNQPYGSGRLKTNCSTTRNGRTQYWNLNDSDLVEST